MGASFNGWGNILAGAGRFGDSMVAHITPEQADLLRAFGGSGTTNPSTGLREFWVTDRVSAQDVQQLATQFGIPLSASDGQGGFGRAVAAAGVGDQLRAAIANLDASRAAPAPSGGGGGGGGSPAPSAPAPDPRWGYNVGVNQQLAQATGYTGTFGNGDFQRWIANQDMQTRQNAANVLNSTGNNGSQYGWAPTQYEVTAAQQAQQAQQQLQQLQQQQQGQNKQGGNGNNGAFGPADFRKMLEDYFGTNNNIADFLQKGGVGAIPGSFGIPTGVSYVRNPTTKEPTEVSPYRMFSTMTRNNRRGGWGNSLPF